MQMAANKNVLRGTFENIARLDVCVSYEHCPNT